MRAEALLSRLPPLDARLRRPEVEAIAARLDRVALDASDASAERAELLRWLEEGEAEIQAIEHDTDEVAARFAADGDRRHLLAWLDRRAGGRASRRDRRALHSRLGIGVVHERAAIAIEGVGIREELLARLVVGRLSADAPAPRVLLDRLARARRWPARKAVAEALAGHARARADAGLAPDPEALAALTTRASTRGEHPWVRDACDGGIVAAAPLAGLCHLAEGLGEGLGEGPSGPPSRTAFLLRRLRVARLASTWPDVAAGFLLPRLHDPSEHVTMGIVEALLASTGAPAWQGIRRLAADPRPRVRLALGEHLGRRAAAHPPDRLVPLVADRLASEPHGLVLEVWARAAARIATAHPPTAAALRDALDAAVGRDLSGRSAEAAASARATCMRLLEPAADTLYAALRARIDDVRPGTSARFTWKELGCDAPCDSDVLGRLLAELAREDFGLWAEPDAGGVRLWRGDTFRPRAWRVFHELAHPAPNKRAGGDHTRGRVLRGRIRAPSARMAEVTATTVPGERTVVDREGSWVPMLPTVDDLLDAGPHATVYSAFGRTCIVAPGGVGAGLARRFRATFGYARLARRRTQSLTADEPSERGAFVRDVGRELGVTVSFTPDGAVPRRMEALARTVGFTGALGGLLDSVLTPTRASQPALAAFATAVLGGMLVDAWWRRERIRAARGRIPLVIGGWGTRGKSGTERIKAALFHGLGHPVFVKTTGCEAMFIQAWPGLPAREVFIFRPHDKSSIWEQADMVRQAAGMRARVMLWECMALRPQFVELLEQDWMRDDLVTLTNAFPDHEDVQGPAGHDIATTISSFVPRASTAFTSEVEFLPILRERARERGSTLHAVDAVEAELWGADLLALFPYQEHPRNIALVADLAEHLGVDRHLAVATMADGVVPDLGVLRIYPKVDVHGRSLRFINGMSANERTGCVTNWRRTGCDRILPDTDPESAIVVVVNNRADRVARSEVFARIVVQDLSADTFVLIGTNLTGLHGYVVAALEVELGALRVQPAGTTCEQAIERVAAWFGRLRVGRPSVERSLAHARAAARGAGRAFSPDETLAEAVARWLASPDDELGGDRIREALLDDAGLTTAWAEATAAPLEPLVDRDVLGLPPIEDARAGWLARLADLVLHARCRSRLLRGALDDATFRDVYRARFLRSLRPLPDPYASGDQILVTVADSVMPGARVTVMGVQNIKGTGLDFAYRWVALGAVTALLERIREPEPVERAAALRALLAFEDHGLVDAGAACFALAEPLDQETPEQALLRERALAKVGETLAERRRRLVAHRQRRWWMTALDLLEGILDPLDAMVRRWRANRTMRALRNHVVSLPDAAATMQHLYARQKGGWLAEWLLGVRK